MVQKMLGKSNIVKQTKGKNKETRVAIGAPAYRRTIERRAAILYTNINRHVGTPKQKRETISDQVYNIFGLRIPDYGCYILLPWKFVSLP